MKKLVTLAVMAAGFVFATPAISGEQFVDKNGIANFGYDVIAYHTTFTATEGTAEFQSEFNGAIFYFASAENKALFDKRPDDFVPAYDGHCAFALLSYKKLTVDPEAFSIVHPETNEILGLEGYSLDAPGILYLNYSPGVNEDFNEDVEGNVAEADEAWDNCLELRPAARPRKSFRDFFGSRRPKDCPSLAE